MEGGAGGWHGLSASAQLVRLLTHLTPLPWGGRQRPYKLGRFPVKTEAGLLHLQRAFPTPGVRAATRSRDHREGGQSPSILLAVTCSSALTDRSDQAGLLQLSPSGPATSCKYSI